MNFEHPIWLAMTPLIILVIAGLITFGLRRRDALLSQFAAERLLNQLTEKASLQRTLIKAGFILLAFALIGISLARPQYGVDFIERKARGLDIVFVLDSSRSMLATDLRPTRLERAKLAIIDLVEKLESDRIGLVVFAGNAFLQTPPTLDYSAFRENLNSVSPTSISRGGSNIGQALREAVKAFPEDNNFKVVVLLTDGEDLAKQSIDTAREIAKDGIKVYSIGIGTPEGTYLKVRSENGVEEFVRDSNGQPVRSRLDEATLQKISQLTGGSYSRLTSQSLETLYNSVLATLPREERKSELQETPIERYQWPLFAAVLCLCLEILVRKRKQVSAQLITAFVLLNLIAPTPSNADAIDQASTAASAEESTQAANLALSSTDPRVIYNQAHESLMAGNYAEARDLYAKAIEYSDDIELERNSLYNMAHAMNQMGEEALQAKHFEAAADNWQQAEELFKSANELDPTDTASLEDAQQIAQRRKALEEFIEQQKPQEQQKGKGNPDQQDSETESGANEQDEQNPSSGDTSSQSNEPQSSESSSAEEQASEDSTEQEQSGKQENTSGSEASNSKDDSGSNNKSTENPADSMQQQDEATVSEENNAGDEDTSEAEQNKAQQGTPDGTNAAEGASAAESAQESTPVIEGMSISDAQLLLDSLRNDEQLLPFTESSNDNNNSARNKEIRDW